MPVETFLPAEILDYLDTHAPEDAAAGGVSQRELAGALGYHPCSMSRPLGTLVTDGLLRCRRGNVRGGLRKQLVYQLTDSGRERLKRASQDTPLASGAVPPPPNPFYGRKDEIRSLSVRTKAKGLVIHVEGPPGIGKSALIARHIRRIKAGRVPFWFTIRQASAPRHLVAALAHSLAPLGATQLAYYAQMPRAPLGREVADLVDRALGGREFLAVVDDAQFANADMRRFLQEFVDSLSLGRQDLVFFISQEPPMFVPTSWTFHQMGLGGLDRSAAHQLTDRKGGLAERFESVYQASLGSPLLLQLAVSNPEVDAAPFALPAAVVDRLPLAEARALMTLAVTNEPLPIQFVSQLRGLEEPRVEQLLDRGILHKSGEGRLELLQVVRSALLGRSTPGEEREAHLALAAFYSRSHRPEAIRERFLHLVGGEAWRGAAQVLTRFDRVLLSLGYSDAIRNAVRQLTLALAPGLARIRALRVEGALLRLHSDYSDAILSLRRAGSEAEGHPAIATECLMQIVELYVRLRQVEEAERVYNEAAKQIGTSHRLNVYSALSQGRILESRGDFTRARGQYHVAFEAAKRQHLPDLELESLAAWSRVAAVAGDQEGVLMMIQQGLPAARQAGRLDLAMNLMLSRARAFAHAGRLAEAQSELQTTKKEAQAYGCLVQLGYALDGLAAMAAEGGRWSDAYSNAREAANLAERLGNDIILGHSLAVLCASKFREWSELQATRTASPASSTESDLLFEARRAGERSVSVLSRLAPSDALVEARGHLTEVYLAVGETELARKEFKLSIKMADELGMTSWGPMLTKELGPRLGLGPESGAEPASVPQSEQSSAGSDSSRFGS